MDANDNTALYLYGLTMAGETTAGQWEAIDNRHPVFTRDFGDITAVLSRVMPEDFTDRAVQERMHDVAWITSRACRHQAVVEQVGRQADVFPAPFGTIFSNERVLVELIRRHHKQIRCFLENIAGHAEWSLKCFLDSGKATAALAETALALEDRRLAALTPGARYFEEKKIHKAAVRQLNHWVDTVVSALKQELSAMAGRHRWRDLLSRQATGVEMDMVINGAFLVAHGSLDIFRQKAEELNRVHAPDGLVFELSGPWPPYSFCPSLDGGKA
jgi:hypothetical protein